jgi:ribosomal protein S18 acetylase RimI-like enzyme
MSSDEVLVREAKPEEYTVIGDLVVNAYRTLDDAGDAAYEAMLRDVVSRARTSRVLVAEDNGDLLGTVTYVGPGGELAEVADARAGTIRMLGVSAAARGRGIGEALVRSCISRANSDGAERIRLDTRTSMTSAQRLYERLGFERARDHDWSPAPGILLIAYVLELPTDGPASREIRAR